MTATLRPTLTRRLSPADLMARSHPTVRTSEHAIWELQIDRTRYFVCPTTTPLYYASIYKDLDRGHQVRYNQITAILFSELISYFESEFAASVCAAIDSADSADDCLAECLKGFIADERDHIELWRRLNRLSEPQWYDESGYMLLRVSRPVKMALRGLTRRPSWFPVVFWVMLALEERSLDISRRCIRRDPEQIEPHYLLVYREHLKDEVRHVHIDWHLIELYYAGRPAVLRRWNAWLLQKLIADFLLPPNRSAIRVVRRLVAECPELADLLPEMERQLRALSTDRAYHQMMYSRDSTPITFSLFDRFPEMHRMQETLRTYSVMHD